MKQLCSFFLICVLLLSLAACGGDTAETSMTISEVSVTSATTTTTTTKATTTTTAKPTAKPTTIPVLDIPADKKETQLKIDTTLAVRQDVGDIYEDGYLYYFDEHNTGKVRRVHSKNRTAQTLPIPSSVYAVRDQKIYYIRKDALYSYDIRKQATKTLLTCADIGPEALHLTKLYVMEDRLYVTATDNHGYEKLHCYVLATKEIVLTLSGSPENSWFNLYSEYSLLGFHRGRMLYHMRFDDEEPELRSYDYSGKPYLWYIDTWGCLLKDCPEKHYRLYAPGTAYDDDLYFVNNGKTLSINEYPLEDSIRCDYMVQYVEQYDRYFSIHLPGRSATVLELPNDQFKLTANYAVRLVKDTDGRYWTIYTNLADGQTTNIALPKGLTSASLKQATRYYNIALVQGKSPSDGKFHTYAVNIDGSVTDLTTIQ